MEEILEKIPWVPFGFIAFVYILDKFSEDWYQKNNQRADNNQNLLSFWSPDFSARIKLVLTPLRYIFKAIKFILFPVMIIFGVCLSIDFANFLLGNLMKSEET